MDKKLTAYSLIIKLKIIISFLTFTFRIDDELKKKGDILFSELGMNLSTALNIFLCQSVREQRIPFNISKSTPNA